MIFPTGQQQEGNVLVSTPLASARPIQGRGAIRKPWAMYLWRGLVQLLRLAAKEHNNNNDNDEAMSTMTVTTAMGETATATAMATAMAAAMVMAMFPLPPPPIATMSMTMTAAFKDGRRTTGIR